MGYVRIRTVNDKEPVMPQFIVISGIDGCGKTTIIEALRERLEQEGFSTRYEWLRYNHLLVRPVHGLCRIVGLSRRHKIDGKYIWRHEFYRSKAFSSMYIALSWLDAWLGRCWLEIKILLSKNVDVIVCDRWTLDVLADLMVDTRFRDLMYGKWYARFKRVMPPNIKQYLITRDLGTIVSSRPDVKRDMSYSMRHRLYKRLGKSSDVVIAKNDEAIDKVVNTILTDWKNTNVDTFNGRTCDTPAELKI